MAPAIAMPESSSADRPGSLTSMGRSTQVTAISVKTIATRISGTVIRPMSSFMRSSVARPSAEVLKSTLKTQRVSVIQASGNIIALSGKPTNIQLEKSISVP